jgi:imidazole glycerol phosphate synthase subunit HisF
VSIGSDAVAAAEQYLASGQLSGSSSIEQISKVYGAQAVVVSIDPRRWAGARRLGGAGGAGAGQMLWPCACGGTPGMSCPVPRRRQECCP